MRKHAELKQKKKLHEAPVFSRSHSLRGLKLASVGVTRERDCVDIAYAMATKEGLSSIECVDVSQSIWRRKPGMGGQIPTLTTGASIFLYQRDRLALPLEGFLFHGWPASVSESIDGLSDAELRDLIGESMALPTMGMALVCCLSALQAFQ